MNTIQKQAIRAQLYAGFVTIGAAFISVCMYFPAKALEPNRPGARNPLGDDLRDRNPVAADGELFFAGAHNGNLALGVAYTPEKAPIAREWSNTTALAVGSGRILGAPFHQGVLISKVPPTRSAPLVEIVSLGDPADIVFSRTPLTLPYPLASGRVGVAVGDFDGQDEAILRDTNSVNREYRDEVAVASAVRTPGGGRRVVVTVYNYYNTGFPADLANPPAAPLVTQLALSNSLCTQVSDPRVIIKEGDLDRDVGATHEIIVGYLDTNLVFQATVLKYEREGPNLTEAKLTELSSTPLSDLDLETASAEGYDMEVSRFDKDTASVVFAKRISNGEIFVHIWKLGSCGLGCELASYLASYDYEFGRFGTAQGDVVLEILGNSKIRISASRNKSKNLFVLADTQRGPAIMRFHIENADNGGGNTTGRDPVTPVWPSAAELAARPVTDTPSAVQMVAGNFLDQRNAGNARLESLYIYDPSATPPLLKVDVPDSGVGTITHATTFMDQTNAASLTDLMMVAADADGDNAYFIRSEHSNSLYLGSPLHFILHGLQTFDVILQEPPKHIDYLPSQDTGGGAGSGVMNISRNSGFLTRLTQSSGGSSSVSKVKRTDWVLGQTTSDTTDVNFGLELLGASKAGLSQENKKTIDSTQEHSVEQGDSREQSFTYTEINTASDDDQLVWRRRNVDIWRYPILTQTTVGQASEVEAQFLEIVIPESKPNGEDSGLISPIVRTSGTTLDGYQPGHINGNLLSYPRLDSSSLTNNRPTDLGGFIEHEAAANPLLRLRNGYSPSNPNYRAEVHPVIPSPIWPDQQLVPFRADSGTTIQLEFNSQVKQYTNISSSGTLSVAKETSQGVELGGTFLDVFSLGTAQSLGSTSTREDSWSNARITESTFNSSTEVAVECPQGILANPDTQNYQVYPIFYLSTDGALKCSYWVDLDVNGNGSVGTWWTTHYDGPDAALNLPRRILSDGTLNTDIGRKRVKGFFVREGKLKTGILNQDLDASPDNPRNLLARSPVAGEQIQLQVRVYNLSVPEKGTPITNLPVRFEYVALAGEPPIEAPNRGWIGHTVVPIIAAGDMTDAFILWQIPESLGAENPGGLSDYRICVTLDPDDDIPNETHEWRDRYCRPLLDVHDNPVDDGIEKGQNNEGYFDLTIAAMNSAGQSPKQSLALARAGIKSDGGRSGILNSERERDVWLNDDALSLVGVGPSPVEADPTKDIEVGDRVWLRVLVSSDRVVRDYSTLTIYDEDPTVGNIVRCATIHGIDPAKGASLDCEWWPKTAGEHTLTARYFESLYDTHPGNATDSLVVPVKQASAPKSDYRSAEKDGAFEISEPGPGANDDTLLVRYDSAIRFPKAILLTNDAGASLSYRCTQVPTTGNSAILGKVIENPDQTITYDPAGAFGFLLPGQSWLDEVYYTVVDEYGRVARAKVKLEVYRPGAILYARLLGNQVELSWIEEGATLQQAESPSGPWEDVPNASSPDLLGRDGEANYFRLRF